MFKVGDLVLVNEESTITPPPVKGKKGYITSFIKWNGEECACVYLVSNPKICVITSLADLIKIEY